LQHGNRFFSCNDPDKSEEEKCKLIDGTVAYRILGYADTSEEAQRIIYGSNHIFATERLAKSLASQRQARWGDNPPDMVLQHDAMTIGMFAQDRCLAAIKDAKKELDEIEKELVRRSDEA
jgi:hypothetical protein